MIVENISQFVVDFIQSNNKSANITEAWNSKKNQEQLMKIFKKNNIIIKDPDKPKRGKSGYLYFCAEYRDKMKKENPDMTVKEIVSKLGILWQQFKVEENPEVKRFLKMSEDDRNRYKKAMSSYIPLIRKINKKEKKENDEEKLETIKPVKKRKTKDEKEEEKELLKSKKKERDDGYSKFIRSKRNKTRKTHPELDSDGILKYLASKWEKFPDSKKEKYKNKK